MKMLIDLHPFAYTLAVPYSADAEQNWQQTVTNYNHWLNASIGPWLHAWAWNDSRDPAKIGLAFRYDRDRSLFILTWMT